MRWHYRLGHLPFVKLKQLALNGEIPKKLAKVKPPKCAGCLFGAMTKIPWRGREAKGSHEVFIATKPGECVSVNQLTSTEVGFYAQMKVKLTKKRYRCATVFVDHYSCLRFVHLQVDDSSVKTITAKCAFKTFAAKHGVKIQHYHCDNGWFSDNAFKQACHKQRQQATHLLWRKCSLPKWHCQALHPQPLGEHAQATAAHLRLLVAGSELHALAIRPAQCRTPPQ
jgi:hypothetical protein